MTYYCGNAYGGASMYQGAPAEVRSIVQQYVFHPSVGSTAPYNAHSYKNHTYENHTSHSHSVIEPFLRHDRPVSKFIADAQEIKGYVMSTFNKVTGKEFPENVLVHVLDKEKMQEAHPEWHQEVVGFAHNRLPSTSEIFAQQSTLDRLLLVIGHELGHVGSRPHPDRMLEEAKAFAFELAWLDAIKEHNIAGLSGAISVDPPAENGLHDAALHFALKSKKAGIAPLDLFTQLCNPHYFV